MSERAQQLIAENKAKHARGEDASYLDLGNCGLTEWPDLSGMDWLETLILSNYWLEFDDQKKKWDRFVSKNIGQGNKIKTNPPTHPYLPQLRKLVACELGISDGRFMEKLTGLTSLDLRYNQISDWSFLENLTGLTSLNLGQNKISDVRFLENLTGLTSLDLGGNQISDWRFLEKLTGLTSLDLSSNQISDGRFLEKLTGLTSLDLSSNQISDGGFLENLTGLTSLDLGSNQISDGRFLENLTGLTSLDLSYNQISDVRFLKKIANLTSLCIRNNRITEIAFLKDLANLRELWINENEITSIPRELYITLLQNFNTENFIYSIITQKIKYVKNKKYETAADLRDFESKVTRVLGAYRNRVENIENQKVDEPIYDTFFRVLAFQNPLQSPPVEVINQGNAAILEYFRQREKAGIKPLLEAKMVLLGDGRAGKTSLACRMLGRALPQQEDRTLGVDIAIGEYRFEVAEGEFVLHIWDFAGQDKYKPLHQFFYTEGAVYVLVADSGNATTDFADWFETAEMFGGEGSPLLVALNEFREGMGKGAFDEEKWRKQFPKLIKEVRLVNLLSQTGFPELEKDIRHHANQLKHTRTEYPANWANIRSELERRRDENYIPLSEYLSICRQLDLPERGSALILSGILHKIGVCLHYQKSDLLKQHVILKNEWATAAVYKILEDRVVAEEKNGFFDWADLRRIWSDDSYCDMQPQLLELMREFKMAYPLPNGSAFVTPPLLPTVPPSDWDFPAGDAIEVRIEYEFLPKALMTQFIVSRHPDIDRGRTLAWREGVVLRWSADTLAQVSKIKSRGRDAFQILAIGSERRGLLTAILKTLRDLHDEYRGIRAHEIVPCPCEGCRTEKNPQHYFDFKNLSNRLEKGRRVVECDQSLEEVDLIKLLGDLLLFERLGIGEAVVLKDVQRSKPAPRDIKIFLASSAELAEDRKEFEIFINRENKNLIKKGLFIDLVLWEDFLDAVSATRLQDEYNKALRGCDIVVCLFYTKVGKYTAEEFDAALGHFRETGKPHIFTYFKDTPTKPSELLAFDTVLEFKKRLSELGHFPNHYESLGDLKHHFGQQLKKLGLE